MGFTKSIRSSSKKIPPKYCIFFGTLLTLTASVLFSRMCYATESYWRYGFPAYILLGTGSTSLTLCPLDMQGLMSGVTITSGEFFVAAASAVVTSWEILSLVIMLRPRKIY